jgi:hypothetical protein
LTTEYLHYPWLKIFIFLYDCEPRLIRMNSCYTMGQQLTEWRCHLWVIWHDVMSKFLAVNGVLFKSINGHYNMSHDHSKTARSRNLPTLYQGLIWGVVLLYWQTG